MRMRRGLALYGSRCLWRGGLVGLALLGGTLMVWGRSAPRMVAAQMPVPQPPSVIVTEVIQKTVPIYNEFVARTEAFQTVELRARVEGFLEQVLFQDGVMVKEGQVLCVIERRPYEAALQTAKAQLSKAEADLTQAQEQAGVLSARAELAQRQASLVKARQDVTRLRPLAHDRAVPQQDLDTAVAQEQVAVASVQAAEAALKNAEIQQRVGVRQAQAAVESAKAGITQAELNLSYTTIRAPMQGIIGFLAVSKGNLVGPGHNPVLATMSSVDPMRVTFGVSEEQYLHFFKLVSEAKSPEVSALAYELILTDDSVYPYKGKLAGIDRAVDPKTGTLKAQVSFPNPHTLLRPGQFGRVRVAAEEVANALLVPQTAVQEVQGVRTVLVVDRDNKAALRTLTTEGKYENYYIVAKGLAPGERVIVEGHQKVRPGMTVTPTSPPASGAKAAETKGGR